MEFIVPSLEHAQTGPDLIGFFVLNLILSDLAILCRLGLENLKQNITPPLMGIEPGPLDSKSNILLPTLPGHLLTRLRL